MSTKIKYRNEELKKFHEMWKILHSLENTSPSFIHSTFVNVFAELGKINMEETDDSASTQKSCPCKIKATRFYTNLLNLNFNNLEHIKNVKFFVNYFHNTVRLSNNQTLFL